MIETLLQEHILRIVALAATVCAAGSMLSVMTLRRLIVASGQRKVIQLGLSGLITGATIWSTHFIAMLAFEPGYEHGYEPVWTAMSFAIAIIGSLVANSAVAYLVGRGKFAVAGTSFGLTVATMHYVGMSAFQIPGEMLWQFGPVIASVIIGTPLGIACYHRIVFPVSRYCWLGGAMLMVLSIVTLHFIGMSAFDVRLNDTLTVPPQVISEPVLVIMIVSVVTVVFFVGFSAISIETKLENEAVIQLRYTLMHDQLTGLPNRLHLQDKLDTLGILLDSEPYISLEIVSVDLDSFKQINEIHGHGVGDVVLETVSNRLKTIVSKDVFVARVGGDEFTAIKVGDARDRQDETLAETLRDLIAPPIRMDSVAVATSASLGLARSEKDGRDPSELLRKSNLALSLSKRDADHHIREYDPIMDQQAKEKLNLIRDLRTALPRQQFELVYQLQNDAVTREAVGCEVLLRWRHPVRGMISPVEFIPLAEETGLIQEIGLWVLRTACLEAATWTQAWSVAVNVAPQQLTQPSFVENLSDVLLESGLAADRLELEITEASVIHDPIFALKVLKRIKKMGVRIAMDDFGTGYSSLATLQTFPFDKIKIDRSFVTDLHLDPHRAAIIRATLLLGAAFGIPVLAEGVETEEELAFLGQEGCNLVQGFYFGKPFGVALLREMTMASQVELAS
tara:strand:+ start:7456 stop:9492 length:2037 start_codon:yes stop_codon:yes gene_type:complete